MGYKNKKKANRNDVKNKTQRLNHVEGTPQQQKLLLARKHFIVQQMLGRPFKKYNLIISKDDGDWFSSEDDLKDGLIIGVMTKLEAENKDSCANWNVMYAFKSRGLKDNQRFFCFCNLSNESSSLTDKNNIKIDKFEYFTWKQEV